MITTTLNDLDKLNPCDAGREKMLSYLGKSEPDSDPVGLDMVLDCLGLSDTLWRLKALPEYDSLWRLYAVWCARRVQHLMTDQRSISCLDVTEQYAIGNASDKEMAAAGAAARDAAVSAAVSAAGAAARDAAVSAAVSAARDAGDAAVSAARDAALSAAVSAARDAGDAAVSAARDAAWAAGDAAGDAAWAAAWAAAGDAALAAAGDAAVSAAWAAQKDEFLRIISDPENAYPVSS